LGGVYFQRACCAKITGTLWFRRASAVQRERLIRLPIAWQGWRADFEPVGAWINLSGFDTRPLSRICRLFSRCCSSPIGLQIGRVFLRCPPPARALSPPAYSW
jgi:hypothetical protein